MQDQALGAAQPVAIPYGTSSLPAGHTGLVYWDYVIIMTSFMPTVAWGLYQAFYKGNHINSHVAKRH